MKVDSFIDYVGQKIVLSFISSKKGFYDILNDLRPPQLSGYVVRRVSTRYCVQTSVSPSME